MKRVARILFSGVLVAIACYVAWDRVEAWRLASDISAIAARGEPVDLSSPDEPPLTPEHQQAAELYAEAAARAREMVQQDTRLSRVDVDAVVGRVDVADIESTFRKDAPALQLLDRATPLPFAGFGEADDGRITMGLQSLGALAALRSDLLAYHGDGDAAAASLIAAVRLQRTLPELFNRYASGMRVFGSLRVLLRHAAPSPASLAALQDAFAELPDEDGLDRDLMRRRALLIEQQEAVMQAGGLSTLAVFVLHPFLLHAVRVQLDQFPAVIAAAREPWPDKFAALTVLNAAEDRRGGDFVRRALAGRPVNVAAVTASPGAAGINLAIRRLALAALAVERYRRAHGGQPPVDLAVLVPALLPAVPIDPFSGRPMIYRPSRASYLLYTVDINRNDDGGQIYGHGSLNPMPQPRIRDFGINVPLNPQRGAQ